MGYARKNALRHEAIARITWGESPRSVQNWLIDNGISSRQAASFVRKCVRKRSRDMRVLGTASLIRCLIAVGTVLVYSILVWAVLRWSDPDAAFPPWSLLGLFLFPALTTMICGGRYLWLAFDRIVFGAKADGPVTDIDDYP